MQNGFIDSSLTTGQRNLQAERRRVRINGEAGSSQAKLPPTSYFRLLPSDRSDGHTSLVLGVKGMGSLIAYDTLAESRMAGFDIYGDWNASKYGVNKGKMPMQYIGKGAVDLCLNKTINNNTNFYSPPTAAGPYSVILGGANLYTTDTAKWSAVIGGSNSSVQSSEYASVIGGKNNVVSNGSYGAVIGGQSNTAGALGSVILGGQGQTAALQGEVVFGHTYSYSTTRTSGRLFNLQALSGTANGLSPNAELGINYQYPTNHDNYYGSLGYINVPDYSVVTVQGTIIGTTPQADSFIAWEVKVTLRKVTGPTIEIVGDPVIDTLAYLGDQANGPNEWTVSFGTYSGGGLKTTVNSSGANQVAWSFTGMANCIKVPQFY